MIALFGRDSPASSLVIIDPLRQGLLRLYPCYHQSLHRQGRFRLECYNQMISFLSSSHISIYCNGNRRTRYGECADKKDIKEDYHTTSCYSLPFSILKFRHTGDHSDHHVFPKVLQPSERMVPLQRHDSKSLACGGVRLFGSNGVWI